MLTVGGCEWGGDTADDRAQINAIWPPGIRQLELVEKNIWFGNAKRS